MGQVIFIRHGEKDDSSVNLSALGYARANELPNYFANSLPHIVKTPTVLIAMKPGGSDSSNRPVETITPLSQALGLPISQDFTCDQIDKVIAQIVAVPADQTVLVCWEHHHLVRIAAGLGCLVANWSVRNPLTGDDESDCFDALWSLTPIDEKHAYFAIFRQFQVNPDGSIDYSKCNPTIPSFSKIFKTKSV